MTNVWNRADLYTFWMRDLVKWLGRLKRRFPITQIDEAFDIELELRSIIDDTSLICHLTRFERNEEYSEREELYNEARRLRKQFVLEIDSLVATHFTELFMGDATEISTTGTENAFGGFKVLKEQESRWHTRRYRAKCHPRGRIGTLSVRPSRVGDGSPNTEAIRDANVSRSFETLPVVDVYGRKLLHLWKCSAGRHKSWRRYPRPTTQMYEQQRWSEWKRRCIDHMLSMSVVWLPSAMLRSCQREACTRINRLVRRQSPDRSARRRESLAIDDTFDRNEGAISEYLNGKDCARQSKAKSLERGIEGDHDLVPGHAFIRFTWKDNTLTNGVGQLDRFLPTGLLFCSGWRIGDFIRNDSHADVYSLSMNNIHHCEPDITSSLEAHVFLDEYHGNSQTFANRHKARMRRSGHCLDIFWHEGRHVFINEVQRERQLFKLRNNEEEFPSLISRKKCMKHIALQRRSFRGMPSFAAIVKYSPLQAVESTSSTTWVYGALERAYERHKKEVGQRIEEVLVAQRMDAALTTQRAYELLMARKMNGVLAIQSRNEILLAWKSLHQAELESIQKEKEMIAAMLTQTHERLEERLAQVAGVLTERIEVEAYYIKDTLAKVEKELAQT
jgi:hypothetical protein